MVNLNEPTLEVELIDLCLAILDQLKDADEAGLPYTKVQDLIDLIEETMEEPHVINLARDCGYGLEYEQEEDMSEAEFMALLDELNEKKQAAQSANAEPEETSDHVTEFLEILKS